MANDTPTIQFRSSLMRVLIVHDSPRPCLGLADALRSQAVVRMAHALGEIREQIGVVARLGCLVCIPSNGMRAREVHEEATRLGITPDRIVFADVEHLCDAEVLNTIRGVVIASDLQTRLAS